MKDTIVSVPNMISPPSTFMVLMIAMPPLLFRHSDEEQLTFRRNLAEFWSNTKFGS
jgi:hypothetical protein